MHLSDLLSAQAFSESKFHVAKVAKKADIICCATKMQLMNSFIFVLEKFSS